MITLNTNPGLLRTAVYERILSDLQQGAIAPGETISLNKLAETLNISKTPLRDALLELQAEGFVTLYPQRGFHKLLYGMISRGQLKRTRLFIAMENI